MTIREVVLRVYVRDEKEKQKAMETVASVPGIQSMAMDLNAKKLTVVGNVDAIHVADKLKKYWCTEILTVKEKADRNNGAPGTVAQSIRTHETPKANGKNVVPSSAARSIRTPQTPKLEGRNGVTRTVTQSIRTHGAPSTGAKSIRTHGAPSTGAKSIRTHEKNNVATKQVNKKIYEEMEVIQRVRRWTVTE